MTDLPQETLDWFGGDDLRARCFADKYSLFIDGERVETTPPEMWSRVAEEIASVEAEPHLQDRWQGRFYSLLENFRFIPGGRTLYAAGNPKKATLTNCYFTDIEEDSIEGIFDWCKSAARTYSYGGGNGVCIGRLRPKGSEVNNAARFSSGAVSFMELFSQTTGIIGTKNRRGALMITIPVDHPDVEDFVDIKYGNTDQVRNANISIKLTDEFMLAVRNGDMFTLRFQFDDPEKQDIEREVDAVELWDKIIQSAWASAEPGLVFWDRIKDESPSEYCSPVSGLNPCAEQALGNNGACTLGHVNLSKMVSSEFEYASEVDWKFLSDTIQDAVRFLDNVVEYNLPRHAHREQAEKARNTRRIGLGVTGLGDMLIKLGIKYDSNEAVELIDGLMEFIRDEAYLASTDIAREKGSFPLFDAKKHLERPFIRRMPESVTRQIRENGLRNVAILTVAPVGSGSVLAGCTSGIEPIFALRYNRRSEGLSQEWYQVEHQLVKDYRDATGNDGELPDTFVTAHDIDPFFRVKLQGTVQKYIDSAISSTINLPRDIDVETVKRIYQYGWEMGCKGITVYREGSREGILLTENTEQPAQQPTESRERPAVTHGRTYRLATEMGNLYVTVNSDDEGLIEMFPNLGKSGSASHAFTEALGRLTSLCLRKGIAPADVIEELEGIKGTRPMVQEDGSMVQSVPDAIAQALEKALTSDGGEMPDVIVTALCPECGGVMFNENGCATCQECGHSKCD